MLESSFDFIEIEFFERRLHEIVKSSTEKQVEIDSISSKLQQLSSVVKLKGLRFESQRLQWKSMLQTYHAVSDLNYKLIIDTERSQLQQQIKSLRCSIPSLENENHTLLHRNLQLEHSSQNLKREIQSMQKKLSDYQDGKTDLKILQVEKYHAGLVKQMSMLKHQIVSLKSQIQKQASQMSSQAQTLLKIRAQTQLLKQQRSALNQDLCSAQVSSLVTTATPNTGHTKQEESLVHDHDASLHTCEDRGSKTRPSNQLQFTASPNIEDSSLARNKEIILADLKECLADEKAIREQLGEYLSELRDVQGEDLNLCMRRKENGELEFRREVCSRSEGEARELLDTQDDQFVLENYLVFDED